MVAGTYSVVTVTSEIRLALGWLGTDKTFTDVQIEQFIYENITGRPSTYTFQLVTAASTGPTGLYKCFHGNSYGLYLWGPTMICESDSVYVLYSRGVILVTSGTPTATSIVVTGALVDFPTVMVQILHFLATHRCQEIAESIGSGSVSAQSVHRQIIDMIELWQGVVKIV